MNQFYDFLSGPAVWVSFLVFFGGLIARAAFLIGSGKKQDRAFYNQIENWAFRSIFYRQIPFRTVSLRRQPVFAIVFFLFHACLLATPVFLLPHNILFYEAFGFTLPTLPEYIADYMSVICILSVLFLLLRRIFLVEARVLSTAWDYILLVLTGIPFVAGFMAYHQIGPYRLMLILHILSAEVLLIVIPFSKLGRNILFFFSRAFIGIEIGQQRGART